MDLGANLVASDLSNDLREFLPALRVLNFLMLFITIWLLISLLVYGKASHKWRVRKEEGKLHIFCLAAIILVLPRLIVDQLRFDADRLGGKLTDCELMSDMSDIAYGVTLYASYFYLWMRQRMIYANPCLKALHGKLLTVCSWTVFFLITLGTVAAVSIFAIPPAVKPTEFGCVEIIKRQNYSSNWDKLRNYSVGGGVMLAQMTLLALFIVPMVKIRRFSVNRNRARDSIAIVVRRSFFCTCFAIMTDIISALLVTEAMPDGYLVLVGDVIYNFAAFVNVCCVVSTLGHNKKLATVFCSGYLKRISRTESTKSTCYISSSAKQTHVDNPL